MNHYFSEKPTVTLDQLVGLEKVILTLFQPTSVPQLTNDFLAFINQYVQTFWAILPLATWDENFLVTVNAVFLFVNFSEFTRYLIKFSLGAHLIYVNSTVLKFLGGNLDRHQRINIVTI